MKAKFVGFMILLSGLVAGMVLPVEAARPASGGVYEGTVEVSVSEGSAATHKLEDGSVRFQYVLNTKNGQRFNLDFHGKTPNLRTGESIRLTGSQLDAITIAADPDSSNVQVLSTVNSVAPNNRKEAIILFNFADNPAQPYTADAVKSITYTGADSANAFYQENSNGVWGITSVVNPDGDVYGWYTIPYTSTICANSTWSSAAQALAAADGFVASNYNGMIYIFPQTSACAWLGLGTIGGGSPINPSRVWANGTYNTQVAAHELGHNFGLYHAHTKICTDAAGNRVSLSTNCTGQEYGDPFDIMGNLRVGHMNTFEKAKINFMPSTNVQDITSDGDYVIAPQEQATTSIQSLRIPKTYGANGSVIDEYYLEFRQPYGQYDNFFNATSPSANGIYVRIGTADNSVDNGTSLLDMTPATSTFDDSALVSGKTFYDPVAQVSITTSSVTSSGAVVHVHFGPPICTTSSPSVAISPASQVGYAGTSRTYTLTVTNNDASPCSPSSFNVTSVIPASWTQTSATTVLTLAPGASVSFSVSLKSAVGTAVGNYGFTETVVNVTDNSKVSSATGSYIVNPSDTTPPVVSITAPSNGATVKNTITVSATASDASGVASIQLYLDTTLLKTCTAATSCSYSYNTNGLAHGNHTIKATATDNGQPSANISTTSITVKK
jgi:hypothetical protein